MGLELKIQPAKLLDVLQDAGVDVRHVIEAIDAFSDVDGFLKKAEALFKIAKAVSEAIEWERLNGMDVDDAITLGTKALDALVEFSGTAWGVVPVGAIVEAYGSTIVGLLLKWAYEAIRDRDALDDDGFTDKIKAAFLN